ncbi:MAG: hypothetical protein JW846_01810 [Dehalococcoidia bacterium]|nr:hypothetical protein [Dehalococcoidia bacterium]
MHIACLHLPHFAVQVERKGHPALRGKPLIIGRYRHDMGYVSDVSEEAAACGIAPDMPLRQAYSLCPDGVFLPYSEDTCGEAFSLVLLQVAQMCPIVEPYAPSHIFMNLRYEADEVRFVEEVTAAVERESGCSVSCGMGSARFVARIASEEADLHRIVVVPDGEEQAFLRELPLESLPVSSGTIRRLRLFGISRVGELLSLPRAAVECQFGKEGQKLYELARGLDDSRIGQWEKESECVRGRCFDVPVEDSGQLCESIEELLESLCFDLKARWQCCRTLVLTLSFEEGDVAQKELHFKEPTASQRLMAQRLVSYITRSVEVAPVNELSLVASDLCAESGTQMSFLDGPRRSDEGFAKAIEVLQQRYGRGVMRKVVARRNGRLPEERFSLTACEVDEK